MGQRASSGNSAITQQRPATLQRRHFIIFAAATILYWSSMYIYVPILSPYLQDRNLSMAWIGFILGSYGLTQLLLRLPLGIYSDRMSRRKPFLIVGMVASLGSCLLFMLPGGWEAPLAGRLLAGICASTWVPFSVLFASYYPADQTQKAMGTLSFLMVSGQFVGMAASGLIADLGGWNAAFWTGVAISLIGTAAAIFIREPKQPSPSSKAVPNTVFADTSEVLRSPRLWMFAILSLLAHGILFITMFGFTPLQATQLGASEGQLTIIVAAFMIPHAFISLISGRSLALRFGTQRVIVVGFAAAALFTALIPSSTNLWWLSLTQALNGAAQAMYFPLLLSLAIRGFAPTQRATAMGLYQSVYSFGMFLGPYLAGGLNSYGGLKAGFWFGASLGIIAAIISSGKSLRNEQQATF
ncbi:MFS transporter [Cohnella faecalis]|uniref:MFS transporter n=1 Tax=Cohnella faecalis TaxID=2315694 RepID=A0A398CWG3_9BACL|nr:MFS transporter [Cohnella faecalis]RIE03364.1 MFS transporter [Cohnella faecalis]